MGTKRGPSTTINLPVRGVHAGMLWHGAVWLDRLTKVRRVDRVPLVECAA